MVQVIKLAPETKAKLVAALRSGEYKQDKGALQNASTGGYCCYGVACALQGAERRFDEGSSRITFGSEEERRWDNMPMSVVAWLQGVEKVEPEKYTDGRLWVPVLDADSDRMKSFANFNFNPEGKPTLIALDCLNDNGWTFEQIADLIEERL